MVRSAEALARTIVAITSLLPKSIAPVAAEASFISEDDIVYAIDLENADIYESVHYKALTPT